MPVANNIQHSCLLQVLADKLPELTDFFLELPHMEAAQKVCVSGEAHASTDTNEFLPPW